MSILLPALAVFLAATVSLLFLAMEAHCAHHRLPDEPLSILILAAHWWRGGD